MGVAKPIPWPPWTIAVLIPTLPPQSPHPQPLRITEVHERKLLPRLDLDEGDIGLRVGADHLRPELLLVQQRHRDLVGLLDHVVVGAEETVIGDAEPGSQAPALLLLGVVPE